MKNVNLTIGGMLAVLGLFATIILVKLSLLAFLVWAVYRVVVHFTGGI